MLEFLRRCFVLVASIDRRRIGNELEAALKGI